MKKHYGNIFYCPTYFVHIFIFLSPSHEALEKYNKGGGGGRGGSCIVAVAAAAADALLAGSRPEYYQSPIIRAYKLSIGASGCTSFYSHLHPEQSGHNLRRHFSLVFLPKVFYIVPVQSRVHVPVRVEAVCVCANRENQHFHLFLLLSLSCS